MRRIQRALVALGFALPRSFPNGPAADPDGRYGPETYNAVVAYQQRVFPGQSREWDGRVGPKTLAQMDAALPRGSGPQPAPTPPPAPPPQPPPAPNFVCGPDVTQQVAAVWTQVQADFRILTRAQKIRACNTILLPFKRPDDPFNLDLPRNIDQLKQKLQQFADIDGWDTLPLFQGASEWLRQPPVFDRATNGPCATPSSPSPDADPFDPAHESDATCSDTVQVAGQCWLNGTVNYGTFGIMVRLCSDFAATDPFVRFVPGVQTVYSLTWATTLIRAYKRFGSNPEAARLPIAWTEATFNGGPRAVPSVAGNRPRCRCSCGCKGDVVSWDYVWEPIRPRNR